ncbi:insulinase family protein [Candidatus Roizmanbacteria bacterium]|nr:insulinase family protein [Candidatus Roizmanbacteria bacterium]
MRFHKTVLQNGLRVLTIPMPSFESATVLVMVLAGSRYETKENNGISHFLEHMAFKGTKKRPSAMDISTLVDGMGGEFNAFTGKESTGYYIKSSANHIDLSMDILSDMLQHSLFDAKEIDKERGVILEEINLYEDTPSRRIGDVYENLLYKDTPMGWNVDGRKEIIKSIKRKDFLDYMAKLYSAHNIAVVVAGGIEVKKTQELAEKYFGKMRRFDTLLYDKVVENQEKPEVLIKHKKTEQVNIALGVRTIPQEHKDRYPLAVLSAILGGGMSSRLFHEVREKRGLAYYIRASSDHYQDCGSLVAASGIDPKRIDEAVKVILEEYRKVGGSEFGVKSLELNKAKEFIKGHLVLELEDSRHVAGFYAQQELLETHIDNPEDILSKIDKVTLEDISRVAKKYLVEKTLNLAIIGDFDPSATSGQSARQRFENLLHL